MFGRGAAGAVVVAVLLVAGLAACTVGPPATTRGPADGTVEPDPPSHDPALVSRSVLPPGNGGLSGPTAAHLDDQRLMYDRLVDADADGTFDDGRLGDLFKDAGRAILATGGVPPAGARLGAF